MPQSAPLARTGAAGYGIGMRKGNPSWFETLRRDRSLFALVAVFALMLVSIQPAVPAASGPQADLVICSAHGGAVSPDGQRAPADHRDCPCCFTGHLCGGALHLSKALLPHAPSFVRPGRSETRVRFAWHRGAAVRPLACPPPGIRAPPRSA